MYLAPQRSCVRKFIKISAVGTTTNPILERQKNICSKHEKKVQVTKQIQNEERIDRTDLEKTETDDKIIVL